MPDFESLDALLHAELRDIYDAEKQLTKALPKLVKKASQPALKAALQDHLRRTTEHAARLERIFDELHLPIRGSRCLGMQSLIKEGDQMIGTADDDPARDAVMIAAAQKVEHYEIASYGTVRTWARVLGHDAVASMLEDTLEEEKTADERLTNIAADINPVAANQPGEEDAGATSARNGRVLKVGSLKSQVSRMRGGEAGLKGLRHT